MENTQNRYSPFFIKKISDTVVTVEQNANVTFRLYPILESRLRKGF
jgi:hypothetical protein